MSAWMAAEKEASVVRGFPSRTEDPVFTQPGSQFNSQQVTELERGVLWKYLYVPQTPVLKLHPLAKAEVLGVTPRMASVLL